MVLQCIAMKEEPDHWLDPGSLEDRQRKRDERTIKRKLGLSLDNPYPRCPARSKKRALELKKQGDLRHTNPKHFCPDCGCRNAAGRGTDHLGYGLCFSHEKLLARRKSPEWVAWMNEKHHHAIVTRHPGIYRDSGRFAKLVEREGEEGRELISLIDELRIARGTVQELILAADGKRRNQDGMLEPLTEMVFGKPMPMSDATRIRLAIRMLPTVARIVRQVHDLRKGRDISEAQFKLWFAKLWTAIQYAGRQIDNGEIRAGRDLQLFMTQRIRELGEPRSVKL